MKTPQKILFFIVTIFFVPNLAAAAIRDNTNPEKNKNTDSTVYEFRFSYSGEEPWVSVDDYSKHDEKIFGKSIAQQFSLIDHYFIIFSGSENDYHPHIIKPSIYNSLIRLKQYYKGILKETPGNNLQLKSELKIFLIKGYLCYSEETQKLEKMFQKAETIEEIIKILNSIKLINP